MTPRRLRDPSGEMDGLPVPVIVGVVVIIVSFVLAKVHAIYYLAIRDAG